MFVHRLMAITCSIFGGSFEYSHNGREWEGFRFRIVMQSIIHAFLCAPRKIQEKSLKNPSVTNSHNRGILQHHNVTISFPTPPSSPTPPPASAQREWPMACFRGGIAHINHRDQFIALGARKDVPQQEWASFSRNDYSRPTSPTSSVSS